MQRYFAQSIYRLALSVILCLVAAVDSAPAGDQLEREFQKVADDVLKELRTAEIQTTGVLKFSVRIGEGPFPTSLGTLNMRLAEKLELALVMANPARESQIAEQVGIIRDASDVADSIDGASHLNLEGRKRLFSQNYPLAWKFKGDATTVPESLIVGVAQIQDDLQKMNIELLLITQSDFGIRPLAKLTVATDLEDLIDAGESLNTRGMFDDGKVQHSDRESELVAKNIREIRAETLGQSSPQSSRKHPLAEETDSPIKFDIWYDDKLQKIEFRDGAAFVKEPAENQIVSFIVRRHVRDDKRYGILVRVNGENTLFRLRLPDAIAPMWVLDKRKRGFPIMGFQVSTGSRQEFRVLSDRESKKRAIDYGRDVGMISIVVYEEDLEPKANLSDDELDLAVQCQTKLPAQTAPSRGQLGQSLFNQLVAQDKTRGLIVEGKTKSSSATAVKFERKAMPVMATSIRYYHNSDDR